ncbi:cell division protein [Cupriavidus sp. HPC(L)]|uniref:AbrB/MazE/SpoVT family DNA-binding domain-containing protein n=1 Tax=Cupriavidus sp. HPC(L) TaxID=1217418 RepID=UPI0002911F65|nr:AbrB/MazE/SpoVT family DNA-binding domain-containing protein [Cupriavidus sp. HPC(L)]ESH93658.1 cell division protein [Cupriavidus sp. HPC(L)]
MTALTVKRWGNSLALRIPSYLAEEANITENAVIEATVLEGKLVLEKKAEPSFSLEEFILELQAGHEVEATVDWGAPVGNEFGAAGNPDNG